LIVVDHHDRIGKQPTGLLATEFFQQAFQKPGTLIGTNTNTNVLGFTAHL
jgi:hypothetical protein